MPGDKPQRSDRKDDGVELETQFILRLPEETASNLRTVIQTGISESLMKFDKYYYSLSIIL